MRIFEFFFKYRPIVYEKGRLTFFPAQRPFVYVNHLVWSNQVDVVMPVPVLVYPPEEDKETREGNDPAGCKQ